jgi:DNA-binding FadR family transcriptional regulator
MAQSSYDLAAKLTHMIDEGTWLQGQRLPPERELAERFGMARNTVRRALKSLEDGGLLVREVGRGTFVRQTAMGHLTRLLGPMEHASPSEIMEVRLIFEPQSALIAAGRASPEELRAIELAYRNSVAAKGAAEFEEWDARFHLAIVRATRNTMLIDYCAAINVARQQPQWHRLKRRSTTAESRSVYDRQHGAVLAALQDRDADAARAALQRHLAEVRDRLLGP